MTHYKNLLTALGAAVSKSLTWKLAGTQNEYFNARDIYALALSENGENEQMGEEQFYVVSEEGAIGIASGYEYLTRWIFIPLDVEERKGELERLKAELGFDSAPAQPPGVPPMPGQPVPQPGMPPIPGQPMPQPGMPPIPGQPMPQPQAVPPMPGQPVPQPGMPPMPGQPVPPMHPQGAPPMPGQSVPPQGVPPMPNQPQPAPRPVQSGQPAHHFCTGCGKELSPTAKFCPYCGKPV